VKFGVFLSLFSFSFLCSRHRDSLCRCFLLGFFGFALGLSRLSRLPGLPGLLGLSGLTWLAWLSWLAGLSWLSWLLGLAWFPDNRGRVQHVVKSCCGLGDRRVGSNNILK